MGPSWQSSGRFSRHEDSPAGDQESPSTPHEAPRRARRATDSSTVCPNAPTMAPLGSSRGAGSLTILQT
eukprot:433076-Pyramimonas_sp.AAC.1